MVREVDSRILTVLSAAVRADEIGNDEEDISRGQSHRMNLTIALASNPYNEHHENRGRGKRDGLRTGSTRGLHGGEFPLRVVGGGHQPVRPPSNN